jgi:hypothetical protein
MTDAKSKEDKRLTVDDEPGMAERFQRGLQRALNTPHQPQGKNPTTSRSPKPTKLPASKGGTGA